MGERNEYNRIGAGILRRLWMDHSKIYTNFTWFAEWFVAHCSQGRSFCFQANFTLPPHVSCFRTSHEEFIKGFRMVICVVSCKRKKMTMPIFSWSLCQGIIEPYLKEISVHRWQIGLIQIVNIFLNHFIMSGLSPFSKTALPQSASRLVLKKAFQVDSWPILYWNCNEVSDASFPSEVTAAIFSSFVLRVAENLTYFCYFVPYYLRNTRKLILHRISLM